MANFTDDDLDRVVAAISRLPQVRWPGGYEEAGLAVLDAVWSPGSNYEEHVERVVTRYRDWRPTADMDTAADLLDAIDGAGGPESFADDVVKNHQLTATRNGVLKAAAVRSAAEVLVAVGLPSTADVRNASPERIEQARVAWCNVRGQSSGITFHYVLMLAGLEDVKPDRMVQRFLEAAIGRPTTLGEARALVIAAAVELGSGPTQTDHRIWAHESAKAKDRRRSPRRS